MVYPTYHLRDVNRACRSCNVVDPDMSSSSIRSSRSYSWTLPVQLISQLNDSGSRSIIRFTHDFGIFSQELTVKSRVTMIYLRFIREKRQAKIRARAPLWWSGIHLIADVITTLHWRPDDRLSDGILRYRVLIFFLVHLVYPSVGRVALFSTT